MKGVFSIVAGVAPTPTTTTSPYAPPTGPVGAANTTVTVGIYDRGFSFSPMRAPSGMVTFVITNHCKALPNICSFDLEGIKAGAHLNPDQSETWTVALPAGVYRYHCDLYPFPPMEGSFTVTR